MKRLMIVLLAIVALWGTVQGVRYGIMIADLGSRGCLNYDGATGNFLCHVPTRDHSLKTIKMNGVNVTLRTNAAQALLAANAEMRASNR